MDYDEHVAAVERESDALATALGAGAADAAVPTCPDWTVDDLARHVGEFSGFWSHILCDGTGRPKTPFPDPPAEGLADWCREALGHLATELRATPADTEIWTWSDTDSSARFAARRCAHELAVHRVDAELARGAHGPIDGALAIDGIEEIFVMMGARERSGEAGGETLHLHGTDRDAEWLITLDADGFDVRREHAKGDLALRGAVSDLELTLYQRPPLGELDRFGDESVLDAWYREFTFG